MVKNNILTIIKIANNTVTYMYTILYIIINMYTILYIIIIRLLTILLTLVGKIHVFKILITCILSHYKFHRICSNTYQLGYCHVAFMFISFPFWNWLCSVLTLLFWIRWIFLSFVIYSIKDNSNFFKLRKKEKPFKLTVHDLGLPCLFRIFLIIVQ